MRRITKTINSEKEIRRIFNGLTNMDYNWSHNGISFHENTDQMYVTITVYCTTNAQANKIKRFLEPQGVKR